MSWCTTLVSLDVIILYSYKYVLKDFALDFVGTFSFEGLLLLYLANPIQLTIYQ